MRLAFVAVITSIAAALGPVHAADIALEPLPAPPPASYEATATRDAGELRCMVTGGIGILFVGKRATSCVYYRRDGRVEFYTGSFGRFGLESGPTQARSAVFEVIAPMPATVGALHGDYLGVGAGASIGRGVSGDALVGGRDGAARIFPIANSRIAGLNVAVGISELHLRYKGTEGRRERYQNNLPEGLD